MNLSNTPQSADTQPLIPASQILPEITPKAVILALFLVIILAAANAYLGLKVGVTVSASIPAAVISMGVLRFFKKSNVLENNIVQTAASAGEALIAGVAFILPAVIIIRYWQGFNYWDTMVISLIGGILGVFFSIPLRRVLLAHKVLRFPEGTAIGQVLKASADKTSGGLKYLVGGGLVGSIIGVCQTGFQIFASGFELWTKAGNTLIYGLGLGFDPALVAAGYIVGVNVGLSVLVGVFIGWIFGIPVLTHFYGIPAGDAASAAMTMWHTHIRYIGVGTMLVGGFWTLITLIKPIIAGLCSSFDSLKALRSGGHLNIPRTERDIPINYAGWGILVLLLPLIFLILHFTNNPILQLGAGLQTTTIIIGIIFVVVGGFIFAAIGGYFAGLIGSTNSPGSALTLSALLLMSLIILALFGSTLHLTSHSEQTLAATALAIIIATILSAATVITNETIQDLKAGEMVGATPWKQQVMLIIGVIIAAFVVPLVLQLLFDAYGIGGVFPHPGMDPTQMLAAPQAGLMAALAQGVFAHDLPWQMMVAGAVIAVICITIDNLLRRGAKGYSLPVLAVGLGIYLPLDSSTPFVIGGIASYLIGRALVKRNPSSNEADTTAVREGRRKGLILTCGIVAGAALMGVILAIPFALAQSTDVLKLVPDNFTPIADILGTLVILGLLIWIYRVVCHSKR